MSKCFLISFRYLLCAVSMSVCFSACSVSPALPGESEKPDNFDDYLASANLALENSKAEVKKAEAAVRESRMLLEEARRVHEAVKELENKQQAALKRVRSERALWERRKAEEAQKKKEAEEKLKKEAEAEPTPPPYSASDAPLKK
jgi:chromosome segregation ATPase